MMQIFNNYIEKRVDFPAFISENPHPELRNIIVIPCYDEPDILKTLKSLVSCQKPQFPVEVIIVINSGENTPISIIEQNDKTKAEVIAWAENNKQYLDFHVIKLENIPRKIAGAGYARKVGMDEAVRRFTSINNSEGIITSLDADSFVAENYLVAIENLFTKNPKINACSVYFEHPLSGSEFPQIVYDKIAEYELYLRYYSLALKFSGFPYYYHTVGSAFAVKAKTYCKQGGMNKKQAGEDFYFLHKIMPLGNYAYLKRTTVYPSPRPSMRVPFGTGPVINEAIKSKEEFEVYHFEVFENLKFFFQQIDKLFKIKDFNVSELQIHPSLEEFLLRNNFEEALQEINSNTARIQNFRKRFFAWFDAFRIIKYINAAHEKYYRKVPVHSAVKEYLKKTESVRFYDNNIKKMLRNFRDIERKL